MIKYCYPDGDWCYRALHTTHAVLHTAKGKLIARMEKGDGSGLYEFESTGFELIGPGQIHT
ncbi:SRPBCC family protein [Sedimentitalea todarodis]|uniref:Uncharacterized protein n=1 Tax=Sedimentitalea todarodis TaxID=1631240 RepID=A0ABU3VBF9_9RHOB|nr:hypothetical protein [Sedimentitalea todarodis]MDU9003489.1 hypothetical protein [Sedimentitalea todarodis]